MIDDPDAREREKGQRKDGKPFKDGNLRDDGSYEVGKNRPPPKHQFAVGDNRKRGKRPKGSKNLDTIWAKELARKQEIKGRTRPNLEWVVEGTVRRAIAKSDRAADIVFAKVEYLERKKERGLGISDRDAIEAWMAQRMAQDKSEVLDDADLPLAEEAPAGQEGDLDADQ